MLGAQPNELALVAFLVGLITFALKVGPIGEAVGRWWYRRAHPERGPAALEPAGPAEPAEPAESASEPAPPPSAREVEGERDVTEADATEPAPRRTEGARRGQGRRS
jgi:hypothetical protein